VKGGCKTLHARNNFSCFFGHCKQSTLFIILGETLAAKQPPRSTNRERQVTCRAVTQGVTHHKTSELSPSIDHKLHNGRPLSHGINKYLAPALIQTSEAVGIFPRHIDEASGGCSPSTEPLACRKRT